MSTTHLDLADIQGNIVRPYGRFGFPMARYYFLRVDPAQAADGRAFVERVRPRVTSAVRWMVGPNDLAPQAVEPPDCTLNIAFTFFGLLALGLPVSTLARMPPEFIDGMAARGYILGDEGDSDRAYWDAIWRTNAERRWRSTTGQADEGSGGLGYVHIWISINARDQAQMQQSHDWLIGAVDAHGGVSLLAGNGKDGAAYQDAAALIEPGAEGRLLPTGKEHFGFTDGIGDPVFDGRYEPEIEAKRVLGRGKLTPDQRWEPLAAGEFLLGHPDESQELPPTAPPWEFTRNGSYMVYRKLHQNVQAFRSYVDAQAEAFAQMMDLSLEQARETLRAKMAGRWSDGIPLMVAPTYEDWQVTRAEWSDVAGLKWIPRAKRTTEQQDRLDAYDRMLSDFKYGDDIDGVKCPYGAHLRRANTRDMLDPLLTAKEKSERVGSALNKRRRILRRGLPYGRFDPAAGDDGEHGIVFMAICVSLSRQFEFVQQQWMQYGLDFNLGNDTCPIIGNHGEQTKLVVAADPDGDKPPYICAQMPQFVTTRGGDYFFLPGLNALRMIAEGSVDPT
ncbi:MAG: hypothetical protein WBG92_21550 [Thiohalocapsa sp.]